MDMDDTNQQQLRIAPVMETGSAVLLDINDGDRSVFAHLAPSAEVKIGKTNCPLAPLMGCPFGAVFEVQFAGGKPRLHRLSQEQVEGNNRNEQAIEGAEETRDRDNRDLLDDNTAQTLSAEDIENMRREGTSGQKIIEALIHNSASFQSKNQYSQEKYKRKKQKKYSPRIIARQPSARSVCDAYFSKHPQKIGFIRSDTLAILLSLANVGAYSDVLVLDLVGGLITAAVAERLGGYGSVCSTFCSPKAPSIDMVRLFNFDGPTAQSVRRASLETLTTARAHAQARTATVLSEDAVQDAVREPESACHLVSEGLCEGGISARTNRNASDVDDTGGPKQNNSIPGYQPLSGDSIEVGRHVTEDACISVERTGMGICLQSNDGGDYRVGDKNLGDDGPCVANPRVIDSANDQQSPDQPVLSRESQDGASVVVKSAKRGLEGMQRTSDQRTIRAGRLASQENVLQWASKGFSSLIVGAPDMDPWSVAQQVFPLLSGSACFAIYHPYLQPMAECMHSLQTHRMAVALQLYEPWSREYQVLPSRTHPHMQMSATGGYILSGIKIV